MGTAIGSPRARTEPTNTKVNTEYEYMKSATSVCPLVGIGTLPTPLSRQRMCPSHQNRGGGGHTRLRVRGWGSTNSDDVRKSLALCLPCDFHSP
jgi:hypothetical protein